MIFQTFDSDIDKISSKCGIFGKSFNDIGTAITGRISDINKGFQATGDLLDSIKNSESILERLYPSKETIKAQAIDIDLEFPERTEDYFSSILTNLTDVNKQVSAGSTTWQDYFNDLEDGEKWQTKFVQNTDLSKVSLSDVKEGYIAARKEALKYNAGLERMTLGAKAAKIGLEALRIALNTLIAFAVTEVITSLVSSIQKHNQALEEARQKSSMSIETKS
jgi:hypothetical protein